MASKLHRLISLDAYLRRGSYPSLEALCSVFEVQPRTMQQDIKDLRERFGLQIRFDRHRNGYYNSNPSKRLPPLALTDEAIFLLLIAIEMLVHTSGPSFRAALAPAIDAIVGETHQSKIAEVQSVIQFATPRRSISCSLFLQTLRACLQKESLAIGPLDPRAEIKQVTPRGLVLAYHTWLMLGHRTDGPIEVPLDELTLLNSEL